MMKQKSDVRILIGLFLFARLILYLTLPLEALHGYGDFINFFSVAQIPGWPYLNYWVEFPPLFPFLSEVLFRLSGGQQHVYTYLLVFILLIADAGNLYYFHRLAGHFWKDDEFSQRVQFYLVILIALPYGWWYFDSLAVFFLLAGLTYGVENRTLRAGVLWGIGALVKFFPLIGLAALWQNRNPKRLLRTAGISVGFLVLGFAILGLVSPKFTQASLVSQSSKGSWETVWALIDGNRSTGNFGDLVERLDPALASRPIGNPARISPWISLLPIISLGLLLLSRSKPSFRRPIAAVGLAMCLFFLWSAGWSVQWVLYLIPIFLLCLEKQDATLLTVSFLLVNVLEWPVLLSRALFSLLPVTVLTRTLLLILAAILFERLLNQEQPSENMDL